MSNVFEQNLLIQIKNVQGTNLANVDVLFVEMFALDSYHTDSYNKDGSVHYSFKESSHRQTFLITVYFSLLILHLSHETVQTLMK